MRLKIKKPIEEMAVANGRSLSEEIEMRLERSMQAGADAEQMLDLAFGYRLAGIILMVAKAMNDTGRHVGFMQSPTQEGSENWMDEPYPYNRAVDAAKRVLGAVAPSGNPQEPKSGLVGFDELMKVTASGFANGILAAVAGSEVSSGLDKWASSVRERLGPEVVDRIRSFLRESGVGEPAASRPRRG